MNAHDVFRKIAVKKPEDRSEQEQDDLALYELHTELSLAWAIHYDLPYLACTEWNCSCDVPDHTSLLIARDMIKRVMAAQHIAVHIMADTMNERN